MTELTSMLLAACGVGLAYVTGRARENQLIRRRTCPTCMRIYQRSWHVEVTRRLNAMPNVRRELAAFGFAEHDGVLPCSFCFMEFLRHAARQGDERAQRVLQAIGGEEDEPLRRD